MSKIAVLLPREEMVDLAKQIIEEEKIEDICLVKHIRTSDSVYEARQAVEQGAGIIVARGAQANFIKEYTNLPVAEIMLSGQELGLLINKAKAVAKKPIPKIGLIGFKNMFSTTSYFNEIFGIDLHVYLMEDIEHAAEEVEKAEEDQVDVIIGGELVVQLASEKKIPAMFYDSKDDSIRDALNMAAKMSYTAEVEKSHIAQFETVLDSSFNGIIKINQDKEITIVNHMIENLLEKEGKKLIGRQVAEEVEGLEDYYVDEILQGKRDIYTTSIFLQGNSVMVTTAPIQLEDEIVGAIISFYKLSNSKRDSEAAKDMYLRGFETKLNFNFIHTRDMEMKNCIEKAKMYAISSGPVVIYGEDGTGKEMFAQCIHNNSSFKGGPFVCVNCSGMSEEMQMTRLFGNPEAKDIGLQKGALAAADTGTLLISDIENLSMVCQYRLFRAIRYEDLIQNDIERSQTLNNRIIVSSRKNLIVCVKNGTFREDLFYTLTGLTLEIPPLRERQNDIEYMIAEQRERFAKKYSKFIKVSEGAMNRMKEYPWPGNELQLESFCERLFLTTKKKTIGEDYVQFLLDELYPVVKMQNKEEKMVIYKHPEAAKIAEMLEKHRGNRVKAAEELGISTTTLWRHMKKYGVLNKYDV